MNFARAHRASKYKLKTKINKKKFLDESKQKPAKSRFNVFEKKKLFCCVDVDTLVSFFLTER